MTPVSPTLRFEQSLYRDGVTSIVAVRRGRPRRPRRPRRGRHGRDRHRRQADPAGLRDSKLLPEPAREALEPRCRSWALHHAVGLASAAEVDSLGIMRCLGLAGARALALLEERGADVRESTLILDGNYDYLNPALLRPGARGDPDQGRPRLRFRRRRIRHRQGAPRPAHDRARPRLPGLRLGERTRATRAAEHFAAIAELGPSALHRLTWLKETRTTARHMPT